MTHKEFIASMCAVCAKDTSADPSHWSPDNPLWGHCVVVALIAQDIFGGTLVRHSLEEIPELAYLRSHYTNVLPEGDEVDFTGEQFQEKLPKNLPTEVRDRERILSYPDTQKRYTILKSRMNMEKHWNTIDIERIYNASPERVFRAWVVPEEVVKWHSASKGWSTPFAEIEPHPGGIFRIGFSSPDGKGDFVFKGIYRVVKPAECIVYVIEDGRPVTILFEELRDSGHVQTKLTLTLALEHEHTAAQQREGWGAMLEHLAIHLMKPNGV